jgi:serine protease
MRMGSVSTTAAAALLSFFISSLAVGQVATETPGTARLIVKLRPVTAATADVRRQAQSRTDRVRNLAARSALQLQGSRDLGDDMVGLSLQSSLTGSTLDETLATLRADPDIEFAEIDQRRYARALPDDPLYAGQWYLQGIETSATDLEAAWDTTTGAADTVIAVLDTGIRFEHPDLAGRVLAGYDFVDRDSPSSFATANDGDGWDSDASDPGDWLTLGDLGSSPFANCDQEEPTDSSWHGTRVAAMIVAATNNATGISGGTWAGKVLPVRVLGKCGGYDSDIIAGMRWAAGLPVTGVPANPNPARILNLSLGSPGSCVSSYRTALAALADAGVLVIVSAGNVDVEDRSTEPVHAPANCPGALAVTGVRHVGTKVGYSSFGPEAGIAAPAGNCGATTGPCLYSLITATNDGLTVPTSSSYTDEINANIGTSFSAPIVSAVAGLMRSVNDGFTAAEFTARIKAGARPFPPRESGIPLCPSLDAATAQCNCTTTTCGAGIADAPGAVAEALRPMARIAKPGGTEAGQNVTLDGSGSAAARDRSVAGYAWSAGSGNPLFVGATNDATATVAVPDTGLVTVRLTVTDDLGRTDTQEVTLGATSSSGGGGGAIHPMFTLGLVLLLRRRRHH